MNKQLIKRLTKHVLLGYLIYIIITAIVMFGIPLETTLFAADFEPTWIDETTERVVLIDDRNEALQVRFDLMDQAEETLDISYYSLQDGGAVDLFYAHILKAADRGVRVRFAVDGLAHNMRLGYRNIVKMFTKHPNIELVFYEPLNMLKPWTWHNRLHDKMMIADHSIALIGGRNIGDKYFAPEGYEGASNDFDLLLYGAELSNTPIIDQMQVYFDYLWEHDFSILQTNSTLSNFEARQAKQMEDRLKDSYRAYVQNDSDYHLTSIDWTERSHEIRRGFHVHNPIDRFLKEPVVWRQILSLVEKSETEVVVQSPYIIPSRQMRKDLSELELEFEQGYLITNGMRATPNVLAHSGYRNYREDIKNSRFDLYEYQNADQSLHMKATVIDREIAAVGSFNIDSRSMNLNTESMVVLDSPSLAKEIIETVDQKYKSDSIKVNEGLGVKQAIESTPVIKHILVLILQPLTRVLDFLL